MNTALNYQPEVLVDTADLSREDWLDYRRLGIGGSDAAAIMGLSPFATIRDLYFDTIRTQIGKENMEKLKNQHPDIYEEYTSTTESRIFRIKKEVA